MVVEITIRIECISKDDGRERVIELTDFYKNAPLELEIDFTFEE